MVYESFGNNSINNQNIEKYLTGSCPEGANNQFLLNLFIEASQTFDEQIQEKSTQRLNPLHARSKFSCYVNQPRYVHNCLELAILVNMHMNNPSQKSVF